MSLVDRAEYCAYLAGTGIARRLPLSRTRRMAERAARLFFDRDGRHARRALVNLRLAYPELPEPQLLEMGRQSFVHFAWNVIDFARSETWSDAELESRVEVRNPEILESALARGRGALLLTLHLGNFELAIRALGRRFPGFAALGRVQSNPLIQERLARNRTRSGAELIDRRGATSAALRVLRQGRTLAILLDQYVRRGHGVYVPLFGHRCATSSGMAILALRTGAPVVPGYIVRDGLDHHVIEFLAELEPPRDSARREQILEATESYNRVMEHLIRKHPEQWMWAHRRFRRSPDLRGDPYEDPGGS